jgi:hypothetical protein
MRADMTGLRLLRSPDDVSFSDITSAQKLGPAFWDPDAPHILVIPMSPEPTEAEASRIVQRLTTENLQEETIRDNAQAVLQDLRQIRDSTGTLSSANLSAAVRVLARAVIAIIRLQLRQLDNTN